MPTLTGIISMPEALAGFSDTNVVLIAALFVTGEGLTRTGIAYRLSDHLIGMSGTSEARLRRSTPWFWDRANIASAIL